MMNNHYLYASTFLILGLFLGSILVGIPAGWAAGLTLAFHIWWIMSIAIVMGISSPTKYAEKERNNVQKPE